MILVVISYVDGKSRFREGGNQSFEFLEKTFILLDFVQMRGGGCPNFVSPFQKCTFGQ